MCLGDLLAPPKPPAPPERMGPQEAPHLPPPPPPEPIPQSEKVDPDKKGVEIDTRRKTKLQIEKAREGVKEFGAIDSSTTPSTPEGGITPPT